ncbi:GNAT family N-acetyltransferase [Streptacidiphilus sp. PAMC 29251]
MDIHRLDPHDEVTSAQWYAAQSIGSSAGLTSPFVIGEQAVLTSLRSNDANPYVDRRALGAWEGAECLGTAQLELPRRDNTHTASIEVSVLPRVRHRGIGAALFDAAIAEVRAEGRTVVGSTVNTAAVNAVADTPLLDSPGGRFAARRGFTTVHTQRRLLLELPVSEAGIAGLEREARPRSGGYRASGWTGVPPQEWLGAYAEMQTLMELDVPTGEVDREPVVHDAERVLASQQRLLDQGYRLVTSLVLDSADSPVGYSTMFVTGGPGEDVVQDNTFVLRAHRGHRLSTLAKAANLRQLAQHFPRSRQVHTWTANSNEAMRSVNQRFGFRPVETVYEVELAL